jgi:hypothetical protein
MKACYFVESEQSLFLKSTRLCSHGSALGAYVALRRCFGIFCKKTLRFDTNRETVHRVQITQHPRSYILQINPSTKFISTRRSENSFLMSCCKHPPDHFCENPLPPPQHPPNTPSPRGPRTAEP